MENSPATFGAPSIYKIFGGVGVGGELGDSLF